jgi:hypothetical protein
MNPDTNVKHSWKSVASTAVLAWSLAVAQAQNPSINWWTVDGGGGTSTGGVFAVTSTLGQPDAGRMTGGRFVLDGGFWGLVAASQGEEGAPPLSVSFTTGAVTIRWHLPAEGWVLDQASTLTNATIPWSQVPVNQYQTNTQHVFITVDPPSGSAFYRLRRH